ncbi:MAG TPA: alpha-galactosidase, partial [Armatimonadota bacterium]|nr:alpha-galactosidase [Armatimonadota bacterium]
MKTLESIVTPMVRVTLNEASEYLWAYQSTDASLTYRFSAPTFEIDGENKTTLLRDIHAVSAPEILSNGCKEYRFIGTFAADDALSLEMIFRLADSSPVVRFRYILHSATARKLTKSAGSDALTYFFFSAADCATVTEVKFSEFNEFVHSYCLVEEDITPGTFENSGTVMGPMLVGKANGHTMLVAYEHGSQVPNAFLQYDLTPEKNVSLRAVKGNYFSNQPLTPESPYQTIWCEFAAIDGDEQALATTYRTFVLHDMTLNQASRTPYIFYNTWAFQERNKHWNKRPYLESMTQERMLQEIDVAHRMGIDVFVLDTGWYEKTGDWRVNAKRFSDNMSVVKERLDRYGMKLGLWFSPTEAAVSSKILNDHRSCIMSWQGKESAPHTVWETEESQHICLVSRYKDAFADELIRLVNEVGVTYFKWDAIGQYGC